jgi:outer membrane autotransporter protein
MKKLIIILLLLLPLSTFAQKNYICAGTGAFFNSPIKDWQQLLGANIEYGRYFKSGMSVGVNFGYWSLLKGYEYNGAKITYPLLQTDKYSFSMSGGVNYFYHYKDLLFEYDLNSNIFLKNNYSLYFSYCYQSGLGYSKAESFNIGINKDF